MGENALCNPTLHGIIQIFGYHGWTGSIVLDILIARDTCKFS